MPRPDGARFKKPALRAPVESTQQRDKVVTCPGCATSNYAEHRNTDGKITGGYCVFCSFEFEGSKPASQA